MSVEMKDKPVTGRGEARCPDAPTTQQIIAEDKVGAPGWVRSESYAFSATRTFRRTAISTPAFARDEFTSSGPAPGSSPAARSTFPKSATTMSTTSARYPSSSPASPQNDIRAYYNACLHRGTKLRASGTEGNASEFKCSFHGWSWNIDGTNKDGCLPMGFPACGRPKLYAAGGAGRTAGRLRVRSTWTRMRHAGEYLGREALAHIEAWKLEDRYIALHVSKRIPATGSSTIEAFLEAYHVIVTHPQVAAVQRRRQFAIRCLWRTRRTASSRTLGVLSPHL